MLQDQVSGERSQDQWSSGIALLPKIKLSLIFRPQNLLIGRIGQSGIPTAYPAHISKCLPLHINFPVDFQPDLRQNCQDLHFILRRLLFVS